MVTRNGAATFEPFHRLSDQLRDRRPSFNAQQRGTLIVNAGGRSTPGEVVSYPTGEDITVNVCKTKHLTNTRAGGDDALRLVPVSKFSLEGCLEFLAPRLLKSPKTCASAEASWTTDLRMKAAEKNK